MSIKKEIQGKLSIKFEKYNFNQEGSGSVDPDRHALLDPRYTALQTHYR